MFKIKKYRKEATDPAQLVDSVEQAARQAKENLAWLIAGVVVAVLAGATVGGVLWMRQPTPSSAGLSAHGPRATGAGQAGRSGKDLDRDRADGERPQQGSRTLRTRQNRRTAEPTGGRAGTLPTDRERPPVLSLRDRSL